MTMSSPVEHSTARGSILVVDDEPDVADLFRQGFRRKTRQGTYVMHFAAEEALGKLADRIRPQLIVILSDINMPGMNGLTLLRGIKKSWPDIPVIMVTAYGDDEHQRWQVDDQAFDLALTHLDQLGGDALEMPIHPRSAWGLTSSRQRATKLAKPSRSTASYWSPSGLQSS